jgi:XTP/dITP diphosphohydrolase
MPLRLFVATTNAGKLADFREAAEEFQIAIDPVPGLRTIPVPHEHGDTFEANAITKAIYYSGFVPGEVVISDDSGLEVDALDGDPGVRSARYSDDQNFLVSNCETTGEITLDERNNLCLLHALANTPPPATVRYHCVLAAARNGEVIAIAHGTVEGEILTTPRGTQGFGYDPLFLLPNQQKTMAELDATTKLAFSHRGRAFAALLQQLTQIQSQST